MDSAEIQGAVLEQLIPGTLRNGSLLLEFWREGATESLWVHQIPVGRNGESLGLEPNLMLPGTKPEDLGLDGGAVPGRRCFFEKFGYAINGIELGRIWCT